MSQLTYRNKNRMKQKGFHKRRVQVSSKVYKSASATRVFQRKYKHAVLAEPAWSGLASVASAGDANWNRLSLKWDRTLVDWYQARIRASTLMPLLPSALNTFYQVPRRNKTGPRTYHLGRFVLLPASEDPVARRNRKELDYWCFSARFQRAKGRLDTQCRSLIE